MVVLTEEKKGLLLLYAVAVLGILAIYITSKVPVIKARILLIKEDASSSLILPGSKVTKSMNQIQKQHSCDFLVVWAGYNSKLYEKNKED